MPHHFAKAFKWNTFGQKHCSESMPGCMKTNFMLWKNLCLPCNLADMGVASSIRWYRENKFIPHNTHVFINYRSEEHTSELQSLMRISYAVFCLKKKKRKANNQMRNYST